MKITVTLENKEVRAMIAKFLSIPLENVIPQRYNFAVEGISADEIATKLNSAEKDGET